MFTSKTIEQNASIRNFDILILKKYFQKPLIEPKNNNKDSHAQTSGTYLSHMHSESEGFINQIGWMTVLYYIYNREFNCNKVK